MLTAKLTAVLWGKWGSVPHFKAKEKRAQVETFAESPGRHRPVVNLPVTIHLADVLAMGIPPGTSLATWAGLP